MNDVDKFVFESMINYPTIFRRRESVLVHALLVIGNGIHWDRNGNISKDKPYVAEDKLCQTIEEAIEKQASRLQTEFEYNKEYHDYDADWIKEVKTSTTQRIHDENVEVIKNAAKLAVTKNPPLPEGPAGYYECSVDKEYANFFTAPENVSDAWLDAMREVVDYIRNVNPHIETHYDPYLKLFEKA